METVTLPDGASMPRLGLGVAVLPEKDATYSAVKSAIDVGIRLIDTAYLYGNEEEVGKAVNEKIKEGVLKSRKDIFITTKLWNTFHYPDKVKTGCEISLNKLGMDYVDLYLIHWPMSFTEDSTPYVAKPAHIDFIDTWKEMEKLKEEGLAKNIGISNFNVGQIKRLLANCKTKPSNLQIEISPAYNNCELVEFAQKEGITVTAYTPFAAVYQRSNTKQDDPQPLSDPRIIAISQKYGRTPAQIVLRWLAQRNVSVVFKSTNKTRQADNLKIYDFKLSEDDMKQILSLHTGQKIWFWERFADFPNYPF